MIVKVLFTRNYLWYLDRGVISITSCSQEGNYHFRVSYYSSRKSPIPANEVRLENLNRWGPELILSYTTRKLGPAGRN